MSWSIMRTLEQTLAFFHKKAKTSAVSSNETVLVVCERVPTRTDDAGSSPNALK